MKGNIDTNTLIILGDINKKKSSGQKYKYMEDLNIS